MSTTTDNWTEVEATAKRVLGEKVVAFIEHCRSAVRGSPDPAQAATEGLPPHPGDLRSAVSAGSETRAERAETRAERAETRAERAETRAERDSQLIAVLHKVQAEFGYLAEAHLDAVAQLLQVPAAKVAGVASFYHYFRLSPRGKFIINVCLGTACYVKGADRVAQKLMDELGIAFGETSTDGIFTLEAARCLGTCGLAPVLMSATKSTPKSPPTRSR